MAPMAKNGEEAIGSMGDRYAPGGALRQSPDSVQLFQKLFAQVTILPLDAIREELVTSMSTALGPSAIC